MTKCLYRGPAVQCSPYPGLPALLTTVLTECGLYCLHRPYRVLDELLQLALDSLQATHILPSHVGHLNHRLAQRTGVGHAKGGLEVVLRKYTYGMCTFARMEVTANAFVRYGTLHTQRLLFR
jgi:hypothetical protein